MVIGFVTGLVLGIENGSEDDNFLGAAVGIPEIISVVEANMSVNGFLVFISAAIVDGVAERLVDIDKLLGLVVGSTVCVTDGTLLGGAAG